MIKTLLWNESGPYKDYITVCESIGGWMAVHVWWNPDLGGFWEPWQTGPGRFSTREEAEVEAKDWAENDGLEFKY